jgi:hypothetical protein
MGFLIKELAERAAELLAEKRSAAALHVSPDLMGLPASTLAEGMPIRSNQPRPAGRPTFKLLLA